MIHSQDPVGDTLRALWRCPNQPAKDHVYCHCPRSTYWTFRAMLAKTPEGFWLWNGQQFGLGDLGVRVAAFKAWKEAQRKAKNRQMLVAPAT